MRDFRTLSVLAVAILTCGSLTLAAPVTLGVMGDSLSDEYAEQVYGAYAKNWVEQIVQYDGVNVGPITPGMGEPRRNYYEYNWARYGATSDSLLSQGQHTGLAAQIPTKGIGYVVMAIGANDFFPGGPGSAYDAIYNSVSSPTLTAYINQRITNVTTAVNTILPTGAHLVLVNYPDYGVTPYTIAAGYTDASKRQLVTNVIHGINSQIQALAQADHLPLVDLNAFATQIFGPNGSPHASLTLGGVTINLTGASSIDTGGNPTGGFVQDGIHPNTPLQGMLGNTIITALNEGYHAGIHVFSEQELLAHKSLAYGGTDTLAGQFGAYSDYVINYVPEPSGFVLLAFAIFGVGTYYRERRRHIA